MHGDGHDGFGGPLAGLLLAMLAAVLFAVGAVLQHEAAERSRTPTGLSLRMMFKRRRWMLGQAATMAGTGAQVAALAVAPVAVVQPMLAVGSRRRARAAGDPDEAGATEAGAVRCRPDDRWPRRLPGRRPAHGPTATTHRRPRWR